MQYGSVHQRSVPLPITVPASTSPTLHFAPGETLCLASDPVDTLHRVLSGHLKLVRVTEEGLNASSRSSAPATSWAPPS
jgi:CRP-like cAMP-binding protein